MNTAISLYIFSGPHLGAKIMLKSGKTVVGSDDSADIILHAQKESADFAIKSRHAVIEVPDNIHNDKTITIEELDGEIFSEESKNENKPLESITVQAGEIFYIASTCMVWNYTYANQESVSPKILPERSTIVPNDLANVENTEQSTNNTEENSTNTQDNNLILENVNEEVEENQILYNLKKYKKYITLYASLIVLLLALTVYIEAEENTFAFQYDVLIVELAQKDIDSVTVSKEVINNTQSIVISGYLDYEEQRNQVQIMARKLQYPVYLDLKVKSDITNAVVDYFYLAALSPSVRFDDEKLVISGYMHDALIEEASFSRLEKNLKDLPEIERNIIYAENLEPLIDEKFQEHGIVYSDILYNLGQIVILGDFNAEEKEEIHTAMNLIMDTHQIPIIYILQNPKLADRVDTVVASLRQESSPQARSGILQSLQEGLGPLGGLKINAVNLGAMPFITTNDGQRLFKGATLASGYTLEEIESNSITLRKGGQIKTIDLN